MNDEYLIKNTTREQREKIVQDSLGACGNCDGCGIGRMIDMYQDYIDGKREISEITGAYNASYVRRT